MPELAATLDALATDRGRTHHERSPQLVLVRLAKLDGGELAELLEESFLLAGGQI